MDGHLRAELLKWIAEDDETRERLARDGSLFVGYHPEMEAVHRRNAGRLCEVLTRVGWPGRSLVGEDGASAAWRIVQHAIGEPALLRGCLPLLLAAAAEGEADPAEVAMLEDRICVFEGRRQRFGTQFDWCEDGAAMVPMVGVDAVESLAERRAAVGLPPMEWRRLPTRGELPPADVTARRAEIEVWARRVGWR